MEFIIPKQQYTGKLSDTGNSMRLPSVFNKINKLSKRDDKYSLKQGTINLDYGAGKYDNITTELAKQGMLYEQIIKHYYTDVTIEEYEVQ